MSKHKSTTKKVTLDELSHHAITNKRQVMKDIKLLNFDIISLSAITTSEDSKKSFGFDD